ncbi:hypothetical protein [Haloarcula amylovorans]|uniref:hypothetical protein n=1 Tax=Haloarcula amylovorans TaxID=2562280 RepID=UPI0010760EF5|nr:hypothetical protein [Halomicroarcula amylolytica]
MPEPVPTEDTGDEWPGLLICVPCEQYVPADGDREKTACEHSWDEASDISHLDGEEWAKFRHDVYVKELERDEPRNRQMVFHNLASLMWDFTTAEVLPDDYDDREGLEKLLVMDQ